MSFNDIKKYGLNILAFPNTSNGFTGAEARKWIRGVYRSYLKDKHYSFKETSWAVKRGFLPEQVRSLNINEENYKDIISAKDYAFLRPINGIYGKWISDKVTIYNIFKPFRDRMPKCFYHITNRYNDKLIIPLNVNNKNDTWKDVINTIKEEKKVRLYISNSSQRDLIEWEHDKFYINRKKVKEKELIDYISKINKSVIITEELIPKKDFEGGLINLIVFNSKGDNPKIGDAYISFEKNKFLNNNIDILKNTSFKEETNLNDDENNNNDILFRLYEEDSNDEELMEIENEEWYESTVYSYIDTINGKISDSVSINRGNRIKKTKNPNNDYAIPSKIPFWNEIKETVKNIGYFAPELEFFGLKIMITDDGFKIISWDGHPEYPKSVPFSIETSKYLKYKVEQKRKAYKGLSVKTKRGMKKVKLKVRATYAKLFFPKGLLPYLSIKFPKEQLKDFITNKDTTFKEKIWAKKHGFISYRIHQYGINDENYNNYISDFEYRWLRHINNEYRKWMEDKITVKYICSDYNNCFPEYYYHIILKNGNNKVISMMDCPKGYTNTFEDIFKLVKEKKSLALKPDEGSHGDGFYKFEYLDGKYYLNHEQAKKEDVLNILKDVNNQYLITEYINMHPVIKNIYSGAVNTIRMIVFKKDGKNPEIGNAYMRFGSKRTGAVDNMGAGGMFAKIDIETGKFYDAKIIEDNEIKPCLYHPDTNVKIEGYLPNWEKVKQTVLDVARNIPELEYFGFDLAITESGIKFPEINRFPDYPAIEKLSPKTMDYLLYKLKEKKISYGDENFRGKYSIVKLPLR